MKKRLIVGNWKLHPKSLKEGERLLSGFSAVRGVETIICPPTVFLGELRSRFKGKTLSFGAQDLFWEFSGSYTGGVSSEMLKDRGAKYVLVGHSERRALGEVNDIVNKKLLAALKGGLVPILCVGEPARDLEGGYLEFLQNQLTACLKGVSRKMLVDVVIAYEPVWAIGQSFEKAMRPEEVHETSLFIRKIISDTYRREDGHSISILYGGSVEGENAGAIVSEGNVEGVLVGHQSLKPKEFAKIIEAIAKV